MNLEKELRKEIQKKEKVKEGASRPRPRFWPAGRSRPSPPAPAPRPRARTATPCRRGEPAELGRRVACMRRLGRALGGHQERLAAPASVPAAICTRQLLLSRPRFARAEHRRCHWSSELCLGRSPPAREPFFNSSLPKLCPRFAIAEHASKRLVTHGEPRLPSLSSSTRAPPPRATVPSGTA